MKKWSINYLHDVIFGEQRVDAEARHTGYGDAHDAQQRDRLSPIDKMFLIRKKTQTHIQVISHISLSLSPSHSLNSHQNKQKNKQILAIFFCNSCKHACRSVPIYFSLTWQHIFGVFCFYIPYSSSTPIFYFVLFQTKK